MVKVRLRRLLGQLAALVVAPLALPPPVNGQALVNASIATMLTQGPGRVRLINISPKFFQRTIRYHLRRMAAITVTLFVLVANMRHARRRLYSVVEPGQGMLYSCDTCFSFTKSCTATQVNHQVNICLNYR